MSDNGQDLIGRVGTPFEVVVERGKVAEFAVSTMSKNPDYLTGENPLSPPTFLATARFWQIDENNPLHGIPLDFRNILHGEQEFVFHGEPPRAGTRLQGVQRVENVYEKEGKRGGVMRFVILTTDFRDESGTLVVEARTTRIETGQTPAKES